MALTLILGARDFAKIIVAECNAALLMLYEKMLYLDLLLLGLKYLLYYRVYFCMLLREVFT